MMTLQHVPIVDERELRKNITALISVQGNIRRVKILGVVIWKSGRGLGVA